MCCGSGSGRRTDVRRRPAGLPGRPDDPGDHRQHKRWDYLFGVIGILALMIGVLTFIALFVDMAIDGIPRLQARVLHQLPVAPPERSGDPVGLGGIDAGDGRHRVLRGAARRRGRRVPRGVRAEELDHRHHRDQHHQPGRCAVDRLRPAGARSLRLPVRVRAEHPVGGADAGAADPADRDRRDARGDPRRSRSRSARGRTRSARPSGRRRRITSFRTRPPASSPGSSSGWRARSARRRRSSPSAR